MKEPIKAHKNILELIGNTPLVQLNKITAPLKGNYFAKVEAFNPGHSSKDRIAIYIIEEAEKKGILKPGDTIIETTSGNTGFSIAMVSIIKGYKCILAVSSKSSKDKIDMLRTMGAEVYVCPAHVNADDPRSYYEVAKRLHQETEGSVYINQYFNKLNIEAHYQTTGKEIWEQTNGQITHLVACSGTGGTISGIGHYLKELFGLKFLNYIVSALLAIFIQTLVKNQYLGFFILLIIAIGTPFLSFIGIELSIFKYNEGPGYSYSDMNGYGTFLQPYLWYKMYWILGGTLLSLSALVYTSNPAVAWYLLVISIIGLIVACCLSVLGY
mgnify:CR=1 FL=1